MGKDVEEILENVNMSFIEGLVLGSEVLFGWN
jgi:hypothetical protein